MSNFVPKPNTGTLWPNDRKNSPNHPDMRGDVAVDRVFLQDMIDKCEGDLVKLQVAAWDKVIAGKNCLSLSVSAPYVKQEGQSSGGGYVRGGAKPAPQQAKPVDDEEIPF